MEKISSRAGGRSLRPFLALLLFNALSYISGATFAPYITTYYKSHGVSVAQIGVLTAIGPLVALFLQPVWGVLADRTGRHLLFLRAATAGSMLAVLAFYSAHSYLPFLAAVTLYSFFSIVITPLGDAVSVGFVRESGYRFSFIRMGGTVGYAAAVVVVGAAIKADPSLSFGLTSAVFALMLVNTFFLPGGRKKEPDGSKKSKREKPPFRKILQNRKILFVIFYAFVFQTALGCYTSFYSVFLVDRGYDNGTVGVMMGIAAFSEVPVLLFIDRALKKFRLESLLMFSGFMLVIRILLPLLPGYFFLVLAQCLQGITYMVMYYCTVMFMNENLGEELRGTGMALLCMVQTGLASLFSNILGGYLGQTLGLDRTFFLYAAVLFVVTLFCLPYLRRSAKAEEARNPDP